MFWESPQHKIAKRLGMNRDFVIMADLLNRIFGFNYFTVEAFNNWTDKDIIELINAIKARGYSWNGQEFVKNKLKINKHN